jgi:hypothetical protein
MFLLFSQLLIIAIDVEIKQLLWMLMKTSDKITFNLILLQEKETKFKKKEFPIISFDFYHYSFKLIIYSIINFL